MKLRVTSLANAVEDLRNDFLAVGSQQFKYFVVSGRKMLRHGSAQLANGRMDSLQPAHLRLVHALASPSFPVSLGLAVGDGEILRKAAERLSTKYHFYTQAGDLESIVFGAPGVQLVNLSAISADESSTAVLRDWLTKLLQQAVPLVIGYDADAGPDLFLEVLRQRLAQPLPRPLYWFCHSIEEISQLPAWLRLHRQVVLVTSQGTSGLDGDDPPTSHELGQLEPESVLEAITRGFHVEQPEFLTHSLGYLLARIRRAAPSEVSVSDQQESLPVENEEYSTSPSLAFAALRVAARNGDLSGSLAAALDLQPAQLSPAQTREAAALLLQAASSDEESAKECLEACKLAVACLDCVPSERRGVQEDWLSIHGLFRQAALQHRLDQPDEEWEVCQEVIRRYSQMNSRPAQVASARALALAMRAALLTERVNDAAEHLEQLNERFAPSEDPWILLHVATAWQHEGRALGRHGLPQAQLTVCDRLIEKFSSSADLALQWHAAKAYLVKAALLRFLEREEDSLKALNAVASRWQSAPSAILRLLAAEALVHHGTRLADQSRWEEACAKYDTAINAFAGEVPAALREQAAWAFVYKADVLMNAGFQTAAIACLQEMIELWAESAEPRLKEPVRQAQVRSGLIRTAMELKGEILSPDDQTFPKARAASLFGRPAKAILKPERGPNGGGTVLPG